MCLEFVFKVHFYQLHIASYLYQKTFLLKTTTKVRFGRCGVPRGNIWFSGRKFLSRSSVLPDNFIAPFPQLREFLSLSLIANCYEPYNLWLIFINVNAPLSRRFWPLWFSMLFLISRSLVLTAIQLAGQSSIHFPLYRNRHFTKTSDEEILFSKLPFSPLCMYIWLKGEFVI